MAELREEKWERALAALLRAGKTKGMRCAPAEWKVCIARELRSRSTANAWIAERWAMGHPTRVCNLIRQICRL